MNFSDALKLLKTGERVARSGWNGKGMFLFHIRSWHFEVPLDDRNPSLRLKTYGRIHTPFIAMVTADGAVVPWLASQTDLLADDWVTL